MPEELDVDALSASVAKRLRETKWAQMESPRARTREAVHHRVSLIREDLAKIHETDPNRALRLWDENVPDAKEREAAQPEPERPPVANSISPGRRRKRRDPPEVLAPAPSEPSPKAPEANTATVGPVGLPALIPDAAKAETQDSADASPAKGATPTVEATSNLRDQRRKMLLENLDKRFLRAGEAYHERGGDQAVAFEAGERRLTTKRDDAVVITAMLDLAEGRGWEDIRLTGTKAFKKEAWFQANVRGIETSGYRPDALDRARLEDARKDQLETAPSGDRLNVMSKDEAPPVANARSDPGPDQASKAFDRDAVPATSEPKIDLSVPQQQAVSLLEKLMRERGDGPDAIARATEVAREKLRSTRIHVGKLISTGTAPYQDRKDEKDSHFVVLEDEAGRQSKVWGVDLPRALQDSRASLGEEVVLSFKGREKVEVDVPVRDPQGKITSHEKQSVDRNVWDVHRIEDLREDAQRMARHAAKAVDQPANLRVFDKAAPSAVPPAQVKVERPRAQERFL